MTDSSKLPVGEWRKWNDAPPQIPWAPIWVTWQGHTPHIDRVVHIKADWWRPTGIYREEYFSVCGKWE